MLPSLPLACQASALLVSYTPNGNGAGERNRTVVSALARPHSFGRSRLANDKGQCPDHSADILAGSDTLSAEASRNAGSANIVG